jgi:hypothetical protein
MSKTYTIRVTNNDHRDIQTLCAVLNSRVHQEGGERWTPDNFAQFIVVRAVELFENDATIVQRFFLSET